MDAVDRTNVTPESASFAKLRELDLTAHVAELETLGLTVVPPELASPNGLADRLRGRLSQIAEERNRGVVPDFETGATHAYGADIYPPSIATGPWISEAERTSRPRHV